MKRYSSNALFVILVSLVMWGCKKDEKQVFFEGGTAPVLTSSVSGNIDLYQSDKSQTAVKLSWTNPNYKFTTGVSSQDVSYTIQFDTVGSKFTNPKISDTIVSKDLSVTMSLKQFNGFLNRMELVDSMPHDIEVRVVSKINGTVPVASNSVIFTAIKPYEDFAVPAPPSGELYLTGSATASDWTNNPPQTQKFTKVSKAEYYIVYQFKANQQYKLLSNLNNWQPQYGTKGGSASGGDLAANMGSSSDPDAIPSPSSVGMDTIKVNFKTGKYAVVRKK